MKIIWSNRSVAELVSITEYIEEDDPGSAERLTSNILGRPSPSLSCHGAANPAA